MASTVFLRMLLFVCFFLRFYFLFIFRQRGREKERKRKTSVCACLSSAPNWGPGLQPSHMSWLGIESVTLWFTSSVQWATPARARILLFQITEKWISGALRSCNAIFWMFSNIVVLNKRKHFPKHFAFVEMNTGRENFLVFNYTNFCFLKIWKMPLEFQS